MPAKKVKATNGKKTPAVSAAPEKAAAPKKKRVNGNGAHASAGGAVDVIQTNGSNETYVAELPQIQIDQTVIARRAWEIWQSEGCPDGREVEHWLRAEKELTATIS